MKNAMKCNLLAGAAEVDITPPVGTMLAGSLFPRKSTGIDDPLTIKAVALKAGGTTLVYALLDIIALDRRVGDACVALASASTGIPECSILWAASHTHSGPYPVPLFGARTADVVNSAWLKALPEHFSRAVETALRAMRPARMSRCRGYCNKMIHNRRLKFKDGREINTWLLNQGEEDVQCLGSAAPIDPEVGIVSFDDEHDVPIAILWHFSLHTNAAFGPRFSADYPGVVAARLRERFGCQTVPVFMPGAFADINPTAGYREIGDELANVIIGRMNGRKHASAPVRLDVMKKEVVVPFRKLDENQNKRLKASQWSPDAQAVFRKDQAILRKQGVANARTLVQAWRIGEIGFASLPGELFVEWGLKIKTESPFAWTYPLELGGDYLGYLVTEQAWQAGGYESLTCRSAKPSAKGTARLVDVALKLLNRLYERET